MNGQFLTVSQLNQYMKNKIDSDLFLSNLCIKGEISNFKSYGSGHLYFSLKDADCAVKCVMFRSSAASLRFQPKDGLSVLAYGRVSVFPRDGAYQLYCTALLADGAGDLHLAMEQLKKKLEAEGLFDESRKKNLPRFPNRIAVITSPSGDAVRDIIRILRSRFPLSKVLVFPSRVQGKEAPEEICEQIAFVNKFRQADLIITGRGGGSIEDLWAFNDERVARAVYNSEIPVISAVGHEPDVTVIDYVADQRASTPSNAAERAVPDSREMLRKINGYVAAMTAEIEKNVSGERNKLDKLSHSAVLRNPIYYIQEKRTLLDSVSQSFFRRCENSLANKRNSVIRLSAGLDAMSPLKVLSRGYSMAFNGSGKLIKSVSDVSLGETMNIETSDGKIFAKVDGLEKNGNEK